MAKDADKPKETDAVITTDEGIAQPMRGSLVLNKAQRLQVWQEFMNERGASVEVGQLKLNQKTGDLTIEYTEVL